MISIANGLRVATFCADDSEAADCVDHGTIRIERGDGTWALLPGHHYLEFQVERAAGEDAKRVYADLRARYDI